MSRSRLNCRILWSLVALIVAVPLIAEAQQAAPRAKVGLYYFDGWSGKTSHITKTLETQFADRMPVWGWKDDTVEIMQKQIDFCADHDIAFWAFCWYYPEKENKETPLNNALGLYLKAPNRDRLKFCLNICNEDQLRIRPKDWDAVSAKWIEMFKEPTYLRLDGKPVLIMLSGWNMLQDFGSPEAVRKAWDSLRARAKEAGLPGLVIGTTTVPEAPLDRLKLAGFDFLTGYNYGVGAHLPGEGPSQFKKLMDTHQAFYDLFAKTTPLPYAPVITSGWDHRPWELEWNRKKNKKMAVWYPDRTPEQVEEFVRMGVRWIDAHPDKATPERLLLIYAWNENGEGGYLTPTATDGTKYLEAVQRGIQAK